MHIVDQIFEAFGNSPKRVSDATGIASQTICDWRAKGRKEIPTWRRESVLLAARRLKVDLSPEATAYLQSDVRAPTEWAA